MRYKKYRGKTKTQAIAKAKIELGNTFIVLKEEEVKSGFFGKAKEIEVTVGVFENMFSKDDVPETDNKAYLEDGTLAGETDGDPEELIALPVNNDEQNENYDLMSLTEAENLYENNENEPETDKKNTTPNPEMNDNTYREDYFAAKTAIKKFLRYGDFDDNLIKKFIEYINNKPLLKYVKTEKDILTNASVQEDLKQELFSYLKKKILIYNGIKVYKGKKKAIAFVGPTGEGKTTTLVKLACEFLTEDQCDMKIVTLDYFRVAAQEQLNMYTEILGQTFEYYDNIDEFRRNCDFNEKDLILIDTAGRSQKDVGNLVELKKYLNLVHIDLVKCLVLSATKKYYDMKEIIKNFDDEIGVDAIILTKLDETNSLGQALSVMAETSKPLVYVTDGQEVPNYIHKADIDGILNINFTKMMDRFRDIA